MSILIEAERDEKKLTISIPIEGMKSEEVEELLSYIKFQVIAQRSKMTQAEADELADEVTSSWWKKNKDRIYKIIAKNE
jgi:hypothetical protein